jgi:hypothetical protein
MLAPEDASIKDSNILSALLEPRGRFATAAILVPVFASVHMSVDTVCLCFFNAPSAFSALQAV